MQNAFRENELAYLAMTSKIEMPFRDRLAFQLHNALSSNKIFVAREWPTGDSHKAIDMALIDKHGNPLDLMELKALYTFDVFKREGDKIVLEKYFDYMINDLEKMNGFQDVGKYLILLMSHVPQVPSKIPKKLVKYDGDIVRYMDQLNSGNDAKYRYDVLRLANEKFVNSPEIKEGKIDCGQAFGVNVSLFFWIFHFGE